MRPESAALRGPSPASPNVIHQALHGYERGHRLLESSCELSGEDLRLVDRLSDASGQIPAPGNDGYITGYPLASGKGYALARTWYVPEPPRPNVVWTHTLLMPTAVLGAADLSPLLTLFMKPFQGGVEEGDYRVPLVTPAGAGSPEEPLFDPAVAEYAIEGLYRTGKGSVLCTMDLLEQRTSLCIAVWNQPWPRLRQTFSFCSGALEPRRTSQREFDLLVAPPNQAFPSSPLHGPPLSRVVAEALLRDLVEPRALRAFLRACGQDSDRRRVMPLLVEAFSGAEAGERPVDIFSRVAAQAPRPSSLRRLKRTLADPEGGPLLNADPTEVLAALLADHVVDHLFLEDARLAEWAERAWDVDAGLVVAALPAAGREHSDSDGSGTIFDSGAGATVRDSGWYALQSVVLERAEPRHLESIAMHSPIVAARLVSCAEDQAWWDAWAGLGDSAFRATLQTGGFDHGRNLSGAVGALAESPTGLRRWRMLRDRSGVAAVVALLARGGLSEAGLSAVAERPDLLESALRVGLTAAGIALACEALPDAEFFRRLGLGALEPLVQEPRIWRADYRRVAIVFVVTLDSSGPAADRALGEAYEALYSAFSGDGGWAAWRIVEPYLPWKRDEWDRCRRLTRAIGGAISGTRHHERPAVLAAVTPGPWREALRAEMGARAEKGSRRGDDEGSHQ